MASGNQVQNEVTAGAIRRSDIGKAGFLELDTSFLHGDIAHGFGGWLAMGRVFLILIGTPVRPAAGPISKSHPSCRSAWLPRTLLKQFRICPLR